jgi:hypothetical protein
MICSGIEEKRKNLLMPDFKKPLSWASALRDWRRDTMISPSENHEPLYFSPKELALRWKCSRSSVDRVARRAGISCVLLGEGRNGIVRYVGKDVIAYEQIRRFIRQ